MLTGRAKHGISAFVLMAAMAGGCAEHPPLDGWAASEMSTVTGESRPSADRIEYDPHDRSLRLFAAANGTAAFQLVADADELGARNVRVVCSDLTGPDGEELSADAFTVYRMLPIRVSEYPGWFLRRSPARPQPRDYYDVLVPAGDNRWSIDPHSRFAAWVDVHIPRDAEPGLYSGTVTLSASEREDWQLHLELEVYDFVLPDARALPAVGGFDHRDVFEATVRRDGAPYVPRRLNRQDESVREGLVAIRELMQLSRDHRLDLFDRRIRPVLGRELDGTAKLDWDDYDAIVSPYVTGSAFDDGEPVAFWPVPLHTGWPEPAHYDGPDDPQYIRTVREIAEDITSHLAESDADARWVLWPVRDDPTPDDPPGFAELLKGARPAMDQIPILSTLPPGLPEEKADLIAPPGEWFAPDDDDEDDAGELAGWWLSPGEPTHVPALHAAAPAGDPRALVWVAMRYGAKGLFLPEILDWSADPAIASDSRLFYPGMAYGAEGILPSAQLKRLRRGLEDAAMCDLLRQRARGGIARGLANTLVRHAGRHSAGEHHLEARLHGWAQDPQTWRRASRLLAEEVRTAVHGASIDDSDLARQRVAWRLLTEQARAVTVERIASRVSPGSEAPLRAEMELELHNPLARPVSVYLEEMELPDGWSPADAEDKLDLDSGESGRLRLEMLGDSAHPGRSGKLPVGLTLNLPDDNRHVRTALPLLFVETARRSPDIDGRLDDWPLGTSNVAGDFRLIGRRGQIDDGLAERQTMALVLSDSRKLYFAFVCQEPNPEGMVARPDNLIRYDSSLPVGEDLVEVVLDPGRNAEGPEDLYHIVVKSNGVVLGRRGVPASGEQRPWAADITASVGTYDQRWMVELAVPLSAFGENADRDIWGVNFTRFATQGGEASSWTGDPRCFYMPGTLGTMFMERPAAD